MSSEVYEFDGQVTGKDDIGPTPEGTRIDSYTQWTVKGPKLEGTMKGVDYILARPDGVFVLDFWGQLTTKDGAKISVQLVGYSIPSPGKPSCIICTITYRTGHQKYQQLNTIVQVAEGTVDTAGKILLKAYDWK